MGGAVCVCARVHDKSTHARTFTTTARKKKRKTQRRTRGKSKLFIATTREKDHCFAFCAQRAFVKTNTPL